MRFHLLQHVSFEGPAAIASWISEKNHTLTTTKFFQDDLLPGIDDFDYLIVMGGPMGVEDVEQYPWLVEERRFIQQSIAAGKHILGICLGAQLIARASGARVISNRHREIGWFAITIEESRLPVVLQDVFPAGVEVFHWHGDTFEIPAGAIKFASSEACSSQGFILNGRVVGLQFHIETTEESAASLIKNCSDELDGSTYVQSEAVMMEDSARFKEINRTLYKLLANTVEDCCIEN